MKRAEDLREIAQASVSITQHLEQAAIMFERNDHTQGIQHILKAEDAHNHVGEKLKRVYDD